MTYIPVFLTGLVPFTVGVLVVKWVAGALLSIVRMR